MAQGASQVWKKSSLLQHPVHLVSQIIPAEPQTSVFLLLPHHSQGENTRLVALMTANIHAPELGMTFVQKWLPSDNLTCCNVAKTKLNKDFAQ